MIAEELEQERGMLDLDEWDRHNDGIARCCAIDCGWEGSPVFSGGEAQTWCPKCEGFGDEIDFRERELRYPIYLRSLIIPRRQAVAKQGRNDPCACGSGKKHKRCCGA
jgi:hypothetical protein